MRASSSFSGITVSILVLMDVGLEPGSLIGLIRKKKVSILVLMDVGLEHDSSL